MADTAGLEVPAWIVQGRDRPHSRTYLGEGKLDDLRQLIEIHNAEVVIADDELTPAQQRNLEQELNVKVLDRTGLVLDIFASRAQTKEAQLQIELAQLEYLMPRLTRMWTHLSRLGGGIGTRGPGETQLEVDKRQIQTRMAHLRHGLKKVRAHRSTLRKKRQEKPFITAAIVGYTNAGKSSLLNRLTNAGVLAQDKLFATLDPTTRHIKLPNNEEVMISDTVGFIQKLPHQLVDAFRATLEEVVVSDFLIHLVDASHPRVVEMLQTSTALLNELGAAPTSTLYVFNKCDKLKDPSILNALLSTYYPSIAISVTNDGSMDKLFNAMSEMLKPFRKKKTYHIPYSRMDIVSLLHKHGKVLSIEYETDIHIRVEINNIIGDKIMGQLYDNSH